MKKIINKKTIFTVLVVLITIFSVSGTGICAETYFFGKEGKDLIDLGLMRMPYDMGMTFSKIDRQSSVVFMLRTFGEDDEALKLSDEEVETIIKRFNDSNDIADWAKKQIAYAINKGIIQGYPDNSFKPCADVDSNMYCAMILKKLGYKIKYEEALEEFLNNVEVPEYAKKEFLKDEPINMNVMYGISYYTLFATYK